MRGSQHPGFGGRILSISLMQVVFYVTNARERRGPHEAGSTLSFDLDGGLHLSLPAAAMSPPKPDPDFAAKHWGDPSKSELSTQPNSGSGDRPTDDLVEFPPLGSEDLIRLVEDLLHVHPIYREHGEDMEGCADVTPVSSVISRAKNYPTDLSSEEAIALSEAFRNVPLPYQIPSQCLTPLVVRPYPDGVGQVSIWTRGPDFWPTPSSVDRESSPAWNCVITTRITL